MFSGKPLNIFEQMYEDFLKYNSRLAFPDVTYFCFWFDIGG